VPDVRLPILLMAVSMRGPGGIMNILMMTNTYRPYLGGVARSVESFTAEYRRQGHNVLVVAPRYNDAREDEPGLIRMPAIQNFNGSDMSVRVAIPGMLASKLANFAPDVVHAHQPFVMGDAALRIAVGRNLPLLFTHHTMWESYTHYIPGDSAAMKRFVVALATGYANLCDAVIAPSRDTRRLLISRGVQTSISVVPTGVDIERFDGASGGTFRRHSGIPEDGFVVGHVGRLGEEKNLVFLSRAVAEFVGRGDNRFFVVVGDGHMSEQIEAIFAARGLSGRIMAVGRLEGDRLAEAYAAFDVFAFSSRTETQGLVLVEAMAAGVPAVALDAPGVREVLRDGYNGAMVAGEDLDVFAGALEWIAACNPQERRKMSANARATARRFALDRCAARLLRLYQRVIHVKNEKVVSESLWENARRRLNAEWKVWSGRAKAGAEALSVGVHQ